VLTDSTNRIHINLILLDTHFCKSDNCIGIWGQGIAAGCCSFERVFKLLTLSFFPNLTLADTNFFEQKLVIILNTVLFTSSVLYLGLYVIFIPSRPPQGRDGHEIWIDINSLYSESSLIRHQ